MDFKTKLKQIIKEELSINNEVIEKTNEIINTIKQALLSNQNIETTPVEIGVNRKYFGFHTDFNGMRISVSVYCYDFNNENTYEKEKYNINCDFGTTQTDGNKISFINIYCYRISGKLSSSTYDSVQHEVEHVFQTINGEKGMVTPDSNYALASDNLLNYDKKALMYISNIIYYSYDYEQDGYVNGLYGELMRTPEVDPRWESINNSSAFVAYKMLSKSIKTIEKNKDKEVVTKAAGEFNLSVDDVLTIGYRAKDRFIRKIGKVLIKVRNDRQLKEGLRITTGKHGEVTYFVD